MTRVVGDEVIDNGKFEISLGTCARCQTNIKRMPKRIGNGFYCLNCAMDIWEYVT